MSVQAQIMASMGCFSINEIREFMGYSPREDGDSLVSGQAPKTGHDEEPVNPEQGSGDKQDPPLKLVKAVSND